MPNVPLAAKAKVEIVSESAGEPKFLLVDEKLIIVSLFGASWTNAELTSAWCQQ